jgi:cysteine desulfurase/selenocysteine lyase
VSLSLYNTKEEVDALVVALKRIRESAQESSSTPRATEIVFPRAAGPSPEVVADEFVEVFEFLGEREARNQQLLDFANELPSYFDLLKPLTSPVPGCMSEVYLIARPAPDDPTRLEFVADSNAIIVRGEIHMLERLFSGQRARDILNFNVELFFKRIGLEQFLTMQRRTGLESMVKRIRAAAASIDGGTARQP